SPGEQPIVKVPGGIQTYFNPSLGLTLTSPFVTPRCARYKAASTIKTSAPIPMATYFSLLGGSAMISNCGGLAGAGGRLAAAGALLACGGAGGGSTIFSGGLGDGVSVSALTKGSTSRPQYLQTRAFLRIRSAQYGHSRSSRTSPARRAPSRAQNSTSSE